ncbi:hypothetical protein [Roseimaritima sediminicola]|uniref:hypothetical protein n=1 Tax=Roseimaritima sediminicola TaxID=2662066 RepID=UPI0012983E52|nr:hypothetical protein [Roseimaritima sediminicola]
MFIVIESEPAEQDRFDYSSELPEEWIDLFNFTLDCMHRVLADSPLAKAGPISSLNSILFERYLPVCGCPPDRFSSYPRVGAVFCIRDSTDRPEVVIVSWQFPPVESFVTVNPAFKTSGQPK